MLRQGFGPDKEEVTGLIKLHNKALQSLYSLLSIIRMNKIKYFGMTEIKIALINKLRAD
jgi:hypothetical protein